MFKTFEIRITVNSNRSRTQTFTLCQWKSFIISSILSRSKNARQEWYFRFLPVHNSVARWNISFVSYMKWSIYLVIDNTCKSGWCHRHINKIRLLISAFMLFVLLLLLPWLEAGLHVSIKVLFWIICLVSNRTLLRPIRFICLSLFIWLVDLSYAPLWQLHSVHINCRTLCTTSLSQQIFC